MPITYHKALLPPDSTLTPEEEYVAVCDNKVIAYRLAEGAWIEDFTAEWQIGEQVTKEQANKGTVCPFQE